MGLVVPAAISQPLLPELPLRGLLVGLGVLENDSALVILDDWFLGREARPRPGTHGT